MWELCVCVCEETFYIYRHGDHVVQRCQLFLCQLVASGFLTAECAPSPEAR